MTSLRSILGISLWWCSACVSNTIDVESASSSETSSGDGSSTRGDVPPNPTVGTTVSPDPTTSSDSTTSADSTTSLATTGPDTSDSTTENTGEDTGVLLDIGGKPVSELLLLAVATVVDPDHPVQGIVWLEVGDDTVDLEFQFLSLNQGSTTEPRELVGDVHSYPDIPLALDGSFVWETGELLVPGEANPITGSDLMVTMELEVLPDGMPYCGSVGGEVTSPIIISLQGSTHAMTTVPAVDALPLVFPMSC